MKTHSHFWAVAGATMLMATQSMHGQGAMATPAPSARTYHASGPVKYVGNDYVAMEKGLDRRFFALTPSTVVTGTLAPGNLVSVTYYMVMRDMYPSFTTYSLSGKILDDRDDMVVIQTGADRWEICHRVGRKIGTTGEHVTIQYKLIAVSVEPQGPRSAEPVAKATPTQTLPKGTPSEPVAKATPAAEELLKSASFEEVSAKAEAGDAVAQLTLGFRYVRGQGVAKNLAEAAKWYRKAAEQNNTDAQFLLGVFYSRGVGVTKDEGEAVKWYRKAADQGDAGAQYELGMKYLLGEGVTKNFEEAFAWTQKAAEQDNAGAQALLALMYSAGDGVPKNDVMAYMWLLLAAAHGEEMAKRNIAGLENKMTREQIAEGQRLARNFEPRRLPSEESEGPGVGRAEARPKGSGSGFFITDDGYLVTNEHVVGNGTKVRLVTAAGLISAEVVKVDAANDLALLKAEGTFAPLPVATSRPVKLGNTVATVGFPNIGLQGFEPKLAKGEIASLAGIRDDAHYFQISVPVQPGNSGGALVDERGNVVGIVSAKLSAKAALATSGQLPENVNYAVKSSFLLSFLESVPSVSAKLKEPNTTDVKFSDVVEHAKEAAALVLVY